MGMDRAAKAVANEAPAAATSNLLSRADLARDASSLTTLRAAVSAQPQRWAWQRGAGLQQPMTPAVVQWLSRLDASTRPPRRPGVSMPARNPDAVQADSTNLLRLWRDGQLQALLRIGADTVRLDVVGEPAAAWQVSIPAEDAAALLSELDEAAR